VKTFAPNWYPDFQCIADRCRHSCCVGWEIDIDADTLAKYRSVSGEWKKRFDENIVSDEETASFRLTEDERCPFLNQRGLCDIILTFGEESLSQICTDHPRYRSFFADRTEIGLGMCCEEAARIMLSQEERTRLIELSSEGVSGTENEAETDFFAWRSQLFSIVQNRKMSLTERMQKLCGACGFAYDVCRPAEWRGWLLTLERLDEAWTQRLEELQEESEKWDVPFEQLLFYLLFRHLSGALDDGLYAERVALCVLLLRLIRSLPCSDMKELADVCRMASSEIEYSDENTGRILKKLEAALQMKQR